MSKLKVAINLSSIPGCSNRLFPILFRFVQERTELQKHLFPPLPMAISCAVVVFIGILSLARAQCPDYLDYSNARDHEPKTTGRYKLPFQRPIASCRTWNNTDVESELTRVKGLIADTDLSRLFENAWPNTLGKHWRGCFNDGAADSQQIRQSNGTELAPAERT